MNKPLSKEIVGNTPALEFIEKLAILGRKNHLSGSYILTGHDAVVTAKAAHWLFKSLACLDHDEYPCGVCANCEGLVAGIFPDFYQINIESDKQNISIEQIKEMIARLGLSSFANNYRFVLINNAEALSLSAANSLLKTLEEPGARIVVVLLVSDLNSVPATIVSRSQVVNFRQVPSDLLFDHLVKQEGLKRSLAKSIARLSMGKFGLAELYLKDEGEYNKRVDLARSFIEVMDADLSLRLKLSQSLVEQKEIKGDARAFQEILLVWQTVIRDMLLLNLNQPELIQNDSLRASLNEYRTRFSIKRLVEATKLLAQARQYLAANVNIQMALENVLINI